MNAIRPLVLAAALATLSACATAPAPLRGDFASQSPQVQASPVRWGGMILSVEPGREQTCFELLSRPLDASARPRLVDESDGRFVACRAGFYDPAAFAAGRHLTVTGRLDGEVQRQVGEHSLRLPRVAADVIYLWPERVEIHVRSHPGFWGPYYGPRYWWWW